MTSTKKLNGMYLQRKWSLCEQNEAVTATLTFRSNDVKCKVLRDHNASTQGFEIDDVFHDLTILHCADEPDVE